jgi:hypothetical protein
MLLKQFPSSSGPQEQDNSGAFVQSTAILYFQNMKISPNSTPQVPQKSLYCCYYGIFMNVCYLAVSDNRCVHYNLIAPQVLSHIVWQKIHFHCI